MSSTSRSSSWSAGANSRSSSASSSASSRLGASLGGGNFDARRHPAAVPSPKPLLRPDDVALVGAALDLAADALPVRLVGVVPLEDHLEAEALRRVPDLLLPKQVDLPVDVLAGHRGLELLDAHEVLLVERAHAVDRDLQLADLLLDLLVNTGEAAIKL